MGLFVPSAGFVLASIAVTLAPGPDILYVLARGMAQGRRSAVVAACGFASGLSVHTTGAVAGLSALLLASATAFTFLKIAGAAYLIYLGVRALRSEGFIGLPAGSAPLSNRRLFGQAFLMNVLNPKVGLFFLAFLPQFTHPGQGALAPQLFCLGACFALIALALFSAVGFFSAPLGGWIRRRPRLTRWLDRALGLGFIGLGLRLALVRAR